MIGTEPKPLSEILEALVSRSKPFVIGCGGCATVCHTGGEPEVDELVCKLQEEGYLVPASGVPERTCYIHHVQAFFDQHREDLEECDCLVILGCGGAVQTVRQATEERGMVKPVISALNSVGHMDTVISDTLWVERCSECGDCMLNETGGICPVTLCAKGLINGPCGGSRDGKCETDPERDCAWVLIYERLKALGQLNKMREIRGLRNYSKTNRPRKIMRPPSAA